MFGYHTCKLVLSPFAQICEKIGFSKAKKNTLNFFSGNPALGYKFFTLKTSN